MTQSKTQWIAGIARGHNSGICLLKDGKIVFSIEEERLSRTKYDGGPLASIVKILEYTDRLDYLVVAHTQPLSVSSPKLEFSGDDVYTGLCKKLGLIDGKFRGQEQHPQVVDVSDQHHKLHAACAFYRSGFEDAVGVVIDGAGTFIQMTVNNEDTMGFETETLFNCSYPAKFQTIGKHIATRGPHATDFIQTEEDGNSLEITVSDRAGIVKVYEAVTQYCGFSAIEAGKTMGLFPYGEKNDKIPQLFDDMGRVPLSNRNLVAPTYPNAAVVNEHLYTELSGKNIYDGSPEGETIDLTLLQNRRDLAYACQTETQQAASNLIREAVERSGKKNVVISGGYGLNCVANYYYLKDLEDLDINLYVEPVSNDAGTAMGAAMMMHHQLTNSEVVLDRTNNLYLGPKYDYKSQQLKAIAKEYNADVTDCTNKDVIDLITSKNIVAIFQGQSENGPRALGNRSLLYDPTDPNGKDHVNEIKHREYFRPFAGSILEEDVHEWFDLRCKLSAWH
jgi:carbamoyltransferase